MLHDAIPLYHSDTSSLYLLPILQSSETAPGSRMALQPHPRSSVQQSRARGSPPAGHQPLGPADDPSTNEGRGTPHDTPEGLDQDTSCRSDHSHPFHKAPKERTDTRQTFCPHIQKISLASNSLIDWEEKETRGVFLWVAPRRVEIGVGELRSTAQRAARSIQQSSQHSSPEAEEDS